MKQSLSRYVHSDLKTSESNAPRSQILLNEHFSNESLSENIRFPHEFSIGESFNNSASSAFSPSSLLDEFQLRDGGFTSKSAPACLHKYIDQDIHALKCKEELCQENIFH